MKSKKVPFTEPDSYFPEDILADLGLGKYAEDDSEAGEETPAPADKTADKTGNKTGNKKGAKKKVKKDLPDLI